MAFFTPRSRGVGTPRVIRHHGLPPSSEAMGSVGAPAPGNGSVVSPYTFTQRHRVTRRTDQLPQPLWCSSPAADTSTTQLRRMALSRLKVVGRGYVRATGSGWRYICFVALPTSPAETGSFQAYYLFILLVSVEPRCTPPSRLSDPFRRGKLSQIFPQRVSRASARRHRKTVFPHLFRMSRSSTFYVLFPENGSTVFPPSGVSRRQYRVCGGQYSRCPAGFPGRPLLRVHDWGCVRAESTA